MSDTALLFIHVFHDSSSSTSKKTKIKKGIDGVCRMEPRSGLNDRGRIALYNTLISGDGRRTRLQKTVIVGRLSNGYYGCMLRTQCPAGQDIFFTFFIDIDVELQVANCKSDTVAWILSSSLRLNPLIENFSPELFNQNSSHGSLGNGNIISDRFLPHLFPIFFSFKKKTKK